jgi:hypothetical protein
MLLLLLQNMNNQIVKGRTRFQKIVFLLQEQGINIGYKFKPYLYGPYSEELSDDVNMLTGLGFLAIDSEEIKSDGVVHDRYAYSLTEEGKETVRKIQERYKGQSLRDFTVNIENLSTGSLILSAKYIMKNKSSQQCAGSTQ